MTRKSVITPTPRYSSWRLMLAVVLGSGAAIAIQLTEMLVNLL